jgi:hypothetical protein
MVAAGVGDDATGLLGGRQLDDLIEGTAELEAADGLLSFCLNPEVRPFPADQRRVHSDTAKPILSGAQFGQCH